MMHTMQSKSLLQNRLNWNLREDGNSHANYQRIKIVLKRKTKTTETCMTLQQKKDTNEEFKQQIPIGANTSVQKKLINNCVIAGKYLQAQTQILLQTTCGM